MFSIKVVINNEAKYVGNASGQPKVFKTAKAVQSELKTLLKKYPKKEFRQVGAIPVTFLK